MRYTMTYKFVATCLFGLERLLGEEIDALGYKRTGTIDGRVMFEGDISAIALGFVTAFICGVFVVRYLLGFVSRHGYALFGWWRIIVGSVALVALLAAGQGTVTAG